MHNLARMLQDTGIENHTGLNSSIKIPVKYQI